ncbi:MAG: hypothetical protein CMJ23_13320 [Phycisphaerae bacterium]|nr:hypothetical protein [Phycisphaerae bacterium]
MGIPDWIVVVGYLSLVAGIGFLAARRDDRGDGFFLAGRSIPAWAASFSVVATVLSAATFVGMPQQAFRGDLTYMVFKFAGLPALILVGLFFLPTYFQKARASIYGVVRDRYGDTAGAAAGLSFLLGRLLASGARLFMAAIAVSWAIFGDAEPDRLALTIVLVSIGTAFYAIAGGIRAVIWTDVLQACVAVVVGLVGLFILWNAIDRPWNEIVDLLREGGDRDKLRLFDGSTDPGKGFTVWTGLIGLPVFLVAAYAVDQDHVQRLMTCRNPREGLKAGVLSNLVGWPIAALFLLLGSLLWVETQVHGTIRVGADGDDRAVMVQFMLHELPMGVRGLMIAGLLAAAMSSLDSALNAMAATTMGDLIEPWRRRRNLPPLSDETATRHGRIIMIGWAVLLALVAIGIAAWQSQDDRTLLEFALGVMSYAYAGLLGVFVVAIFTRRGSSKSVISALIIGGLVILATEPVLLRSFDLDGVPKLALGWRMTLAAAIAMAVAAIPAEPRPLHST